MEMTNQVPGRYRILVIDDNRDSALTLSMLLSLKGFETQACHSGHEGLIHVEQFRPHAVLLDLAMPVLDGYETCRLIRALPGGNDYILIALSGYNQPDDINRSFTVGFNAHMVKPVNITLLIDLLTEQLAKKGVNS